MKTIILQIQGKGGVGKSVISSYLAQYLKHNNQKIVCYDCDSVNPTFHSFTALNVIKVLLGERPDEINSIYFDSLMENLINDNEHDFAIIDIGASSFLPLISYMKENNICELFHENNIDLRLQSIIFGGQPVLETIANFAMIAKNFPNNKIDLWINEYFNPAVIDGVKFEQTDIFSDLSTSINSLIYVASVAMQTTGNNINQMLSNKLTFDEYLTKKKNREHAFDMMSRRRIALYRGLIYQAIDIAEFISVN